MLCTHCICHSFTYWLKLNIFLSNTTLVILYAVTTFPLFNLGPYLFKTCNCTPTRCSLLYTLMILQEAGYKTFCVGLRSFYRKLSSSAFGKSVSSSSTIFYTNVGNHTSHKLLLSAFSLTIPMVFVDVQSFKSSSRFCLRLPLLPKTNPSKILLCKFHFSSN